MRFMIKHVIGPKFRRAGRSIPAWRKIDEFIIKNQKVPPGTEICPVLVNDMGAEWVRAQGTQPHNAILYLHGGGFVMGSPATHRELAALLSASINASVLLLDYRLAPEYPFPAAMQDAMSAYRWLLDKGYTQKNVAIGGDSAGGGLALQTLIALRDEETPLPAAAFFLSPVTDMVYLDGESYTTRVHLDPMVIPENCRIIMPHYVSDNDPDTPLLSPARMDLSRLPPLCVHVGDHEILLSDSVRLAERARAFNVDVVFKIWPRMWHVFQAAARWVPEARQSIDEIGRFVMKHLDQPPTVGNG
jgi:acetyl esterase/lipase